ncbi:alpha/beta hydrolase fold protein [Tanacetum coccineum]
MPIFEISEIVKSLGVSFDLSPRQKAVVECLRAPRAQNFLTVNPIEGLGQHLKMSTQQNPGIEQQKITIQNNHGEKLVGLLHETGSKEIVILCHGFQCTKEYSMIMELAFALEKQGISAFRFDFSGNGESEGSLQFGNYRKEVDDLHTVIQHFTAANRVICAILGHSKGGNVVVLYASSHHDIPIVANVSGRYKMDRGIEERLGKVLEYGSRITRIHYEYVSLLGAHTLIHGEHVLYFTF